MSNKFLLFAVIIALISVAVAIVPYLNVYGTKIVVSHEKWGQFGDYFGGVLNPIFAMFAFIALLYSISLQIRELKEASSALTTQAKSAELQLILTRESQTKNDFLSVLRDIDERISIELKVVVSPPNARTTLYMAHMVSEAQRIKFTKNVKSDSYRMFVETARLEGSVIEASVREINYLLNQMRDFLVYYSDLERARVSPVTMYYAKKCLGITYMLEDIGLAQKDLRNFFTTVGDEHG